MSDRPLVSVLVAAYDPGRAFEASLRSILDQSHRAIEVLVIDDGSTDGAVEHAKAGIDDSRVRWFRQENSGKSVALNLALRELRGAYYAIQDADDLMHPERIAKQAAALDENPDLAAVFCGHELLINNKPVAPRFRAKDREACREDIEQFRMPAHDPTVMFRVEIVRGMEYEPALRVGQGYDYILRIGEQHPMIVLGECLYSYRVSPGSNTRTGVARRQEFVRRVLERAASRRNRSVPDLSAPRGARDNNLAAHFMESVVDLRAAGRWWAAVVTGLHCIRLGPVDPHYYKAFAYALMPAGLRRRLRPSERESTGRGAVGAA